MSFPKVLEIDDFQDFRQSLGASGIIFRQFGAQLRKSKYFVPSFFHSMWFCQQLLFGQAPTRRLICINSFFSLQHRQAPCALKEVLIAYISISAEWISHRSQKSVLLLSLHTSRHMYQFYVQPWRRLIKAYMISLLVPVVLKRRRVLRTPPSFCLSK